MRGSRNFRRGERGVQVNLTKRSLTTYFFFKSSAYITEVKWLNSKITIIFQGSRGGLTFSRGSNCLLPIETHITCDFPGVPDPLYPLSGSALVIQQSSEEENAGYFFNCIMGVSVLCLSCWSAVYD